MIVRVVPSYKDVNLWTVEVKQGCQSFRLDYEDEERINADWYAKMFRQALKNHDEEQHV